MIAIYSYAFVMIAGTYHHAQLLSIFQKLKMKQRLNTMTVPWTSWCRRRFPLCSANAAIALYHGQKDKDKFVSFLSFISFFAWPWGLPAAPSASCSDLMGEGCGSPLVIRATSCFESGLVREYINYTYTSYSERSVLFLQHCRTDTVKCF